MIESAKENEIANMSERYVIRFAKRKETSCQFSRLLLESNGFKLSNQNPRTSCMPISLLASVFGKRQLVHECKYFPSEDFLASISLVKDQFRLDFENIDDSRHCLFYLFFLLLTNANERMRKGQVNTLYEEKKKKKKKRQV